MTHHYEEVPPGRVPVVQRVAAEAAREFAQRDLGLSFEVRWFRPLSATDIRAWPEGRRFESATAMSGRADGFDPLAWVSTAQSPREVARTVVHEAKHLQQFRFGLLPLSKFALRHDDGSVLDRAEAEAVAYERRSAQFLPITDAGYQALSRELT
jgi:hypothetical protein